MRSRLNFDEFLALFDARYGPVFNDIDKNGGGSVSHVEFVAVRYPYAMR